MLSTEVEVARGVLTDKQRRVYEFICDYLRRNGFPPTVREIGAAFGITSPNGVMCHLRAIEAKGWIRRDKRDSRAIRIDDVHGGVPKRAGRGVPVLGRISAGGLLEAIEIDANETWSLDELFTAVEYAAVVEGPGWECRHVVDGDKLLFARGRCVGMIRLLPG